MTAPDQSEPALALEQLRRLVKLAEQTASISTSPAWAATTNTTSPPGTTRSTKPTAGTPRPASGSRRQDLRRQPRRLLLRPHERTHPARRTKKETDWLAGEFAGKHFVQRIALDLAGRTPRQSPKPGSTHWSAAIRHHDAPPPHHRRRHPLGHRLPRPSRSSTHPEVGRTTSTSSASTSTPKTGEVDRALTALAVYDVGKPLVIEEMFPLQCSPDELAQFIRPLPPTHRRLHQLLLGLTPAEYHQLADIPSAITAAWLDFFQYRPSPTPNYPISLTRIPIPQDRL